MLYNRTVLLDSTQEQQVISDYAPFELTVNPSNIAFSKKIRAIEYVWGDGTTDIVKYRPLIGINTNLSFPTDIGDPRNYSKSKYFYSNDPSLSKYVTTINVYFFGLPNPFVFTIVLTLKNPPMDYSLNSFFDEIHLVKTKMFGLDNEILYTFQTQNEDCLLMSLVNWKLKPKPVVNPEKLSKPYNYINPFANKFKNANNIQVTPVKVIPYEKTTYVNPDDNPIPQFVATPTVTQTKTPTHTVTPTKTSVTPTPSYTSSITPTVTPTPTYTYIPTVTSRTIYKPFFSSEEDMTAFRGNNATLQIYTIDDLNISKFVIDKIVYYLDKANQYFYNVIGENPEIYVSYKGTNVVSVVDFTCSDYGCGQYGYSGSEITHDTWQNLYHNLNQNDQFESTIFFEIAKNYYLNSLQKIEPIPNQAVFGDGFASFFRFWIVSQLGLNAAPIFGANYNYDDYYNAVVSLMSTYYIDSQYDFYNTFYSNVAPTNYFNLNGSDLFTSLLFDLYGRFGNSVLNIWKYVKVLNITSGNDLADANDTFITAASKAVGYNLFDLFTIAYRWPTSDNLNDTLSYLQPY
jgi:hypothetical protein